MSNFLGLQGLRVLDEFETWERVYFEAEVDVDVVLCEACGSRAGLHKYGPWNPVVINDTPARGRPTEIKIHQHNYRCRPCARTFVGAAPEINRRQKMTRRLVRYIQDSAMHRPRSAIAEEVGIESDRVKGIALKLASRLLAHKFPTPRVLGIDDIKMNKKVYTIFTDSERGHAVGLIETAERDNIARWIHTNLDRTKIDVVVSDLAATIIEAVHAALPDAIHVLDRWHVQQACQKAMSVVISQTVAGLKRTKVCNGEGVSADNAGKKAKTIQSLRAELLGRVRRRPADQMGLFDEALLQPVLAQYERISRAFWVRIALGEIYRSDDEASARQRVALFCKAAKHPEIAEAMKKVVNSVLSHERLILNYFTAQTRFPDIPAAALTTSSTENRNGKLRRSWKAGRGVRNFSYLRMLALYEPWRLDRDILLCGGSLAGVPCKNVEGPVSLVPGLVGQDPDQSMALPPPWRCQACCSSTFGGVQPT